MRWFRSLFWKIFLAIWLSSLVVLAVTVLVISQLAEEERYKSLLAERAQTRAEQLVEVFERAGHEGLKELHDERQRWRRHRLGPPDDEFDRPPPPPDARFGPRPPPPPLIRIYEQQSGLQVFGPPKRRADPREPLKLSVISGSGRSYRVEVSWRRKAAPFKYLFRFVLSYQVVMILVASAMAAGLLTWLVVRPLNRLRRHTRDLHQGDLGSRAGRRLSGRRDEIGDLTREFNFMADYVERTLTGGQKLLQDVSHELRAPLARLQVAAGLAEQRLGEGDRIAARINRECDQLDRLIDEILSLSRLDSVEAAGEPFELAELLAELREDAAFSAPQRALHWPAPECLCRVAGNRQLLLRALGNILNNALKHTPDDAALHVQLERQPQQCVIRFRDEGPGVDATLLERLFEPFVRAGSDADGYGLGLSIARRAVERLGGRIRARNHPDGGLEVAIELPLSE
ncbi:sensor histidine kinase [Marinobacterium arenosum]|uniref:sensor histidine kinase n=1 Tax=Marinobacterium arenosum TaxID=2862496 RepID=UPI001C97C762|nr:HAMP domain-containing sensor histidine kinase [Marinobacterium arenosum]MBY4678622.1 HAMP domain-containing histidine kinase [Marinobacterium arenosum]